VAFFVQSVYLVESDVSVRKIRRHRRILTESKASP